jgi:hypothetical protein
LELKVMQWLQPAVLVQLWLLQRVMTVGRLTLLQIARVPLV